MLVGLSSINHDKRKLMIKDNCNLCGSQKTKRICQIKEMAPICPPCCSKIRNEVCEGCSYYVSLMKYEKDKQEKKKFTTMIDLQIDDECDKALKLVERGNIAEGEKLLTGLDKKYPNYHTVKYGIGVCRISQGKAEESLGYFKKAVDIYPYFVEAHFNIAAAYMKLGNIAKAVKSYREVIHIGGNDELAVEAKRIVDDMERHIMEKSEINMDTYLKNNETFDRAFASMQGGRI